MRQAIYNKLNGDTELAAILTGGLFYRQGISRDKTPEAFDAYGDLKPCAVLAMGTLAPRTEQGMADLFFKVYFYQQTGYDQIDLAIERTYDLLHEQQVTASNGFCYEILHANDLGDSEDPALLMPMNFSRFRAVLLRRV